MSTMDTKQTRELINITKSMLTEQVTTPSNKILGTIVEAVAKSVINANQKDIAQAFAGKVKPRSSDEMMQLKEELWNDIEWNIRNYINEHIFVSEGDGSAVFESNAYLDFLELIFQHIITLKLR